MTGVGGSPDSSSDRQALLELLLADEGIELTSDAIVARDPAQPPVLSYAQERMWFLDQFESDTTSLAVRVATAVRGPLDVDAYRRALDEIYARHAVLRTLIVSQAGRPTPCVLPPGPMPVEQLDVAGDQSAVAGILAAEAVRTFDLEREPPVHVTIVRVDAEHHMVSVVMHHIASDGTSMGVFFAELGALYGAFRAGRPSPLAPLAVQYDDYATWQRTSAATTYERQLEYWREQLAGLPVFEIPPDHQRPARHDFAGGSVLARLDGALVAGVERLAQSSSATTFMVLLAAFDVVAARHAGQSDVVVGAPIAGRVRPQLTPMIGAFLNTIVLRTDHGDNPTFSQLLQRVRDVTLAAYDNQDVPFELLLQALKPPRDISRTPLFQVMFNMNYFDADDAVGLDELRTELIEQPDVGSKFDLTVYLDDIAGEMTLRLVFNRSLYEPEHMERLVEQYLHVLAQVVADPQRAVDDLSLVTPADAAVLPDPTSPLPARWHGSVPAAVRRVASRAHERVAVVDNGRQWSYGMLTTHMVRLAGWLRLRRIGRGDVVAIYAHRSGSLVWAITGVLASGAAYLILDPRYPPSRLAKLLRIGRPTAWVALDDAGPPPADVLEALDELGVEHRITLPGGGDDAALDPCGEPPATGPGSDDDVLAAIGAIGPDDPACLTFTSGSTGVPKAVVGRHGSLTNFLPWMSDEFGLGEDDRFSMLSGLAHDPLQRDVFGPLWLGATVVVPDAGSIPDPGYLARWMRDEGVSAAHLTPAMGQLLAEVDEVDPAPTVPGLRRLFFIGEPLTRGLVERLTHVAPAARMVNLYGTTETQRASGFRDVDGDAAVPAGVQRKEIVPIGPGMPGCQLLVRTASGGQAAIGEVGEITFRSPHLALGYWDDPVLTAARFAPDPAGTSPADQIYATGDLGRHRSDGSIDYLGRNDQQVQLRGFRLELGEVSAALRNAAEVVDAVVQLEDDTLGRPRLVAYVVPAQEDTFTPSETLRELRAVLPAHAVPSVVVTLETIPLTPNGKIDRRALPQSDAPVQPADDGAPRDELERTICDIWADVLGHKHVGIDDDFFDLGGYSLLATRVFALIDQRTGHRLPVSVLFEHPTIASLATAIRDDGWRTNRTSLVPIQPAGSRQPFFYVASYLGGVLELAPLADELGTAQPLYGLQPQGLDGSLSAHTTIEEMAAHYIAEMRSVQPEGPYAVGGHCSGSWVAFEMARQLEDAGDSLSCLVLVDLGPPGVERPDVQPLRYVANRIRHYARGGRLRPAIAWKLKLLSARFFLRRVGSATARYENTVREAHRLAHAKYQGGRIRQDIVLVLSDDSLTLSGKQWYMKWEELTDGQVTARHIGGPHANLLVQPWVVGLGRSVAEVLEATAATTDDGRRAPTEPRPQAMGTT